MRVYEGQRVMKLVITVTSIQDNSCRNTQANEDIKANALQEPRYLFSRQDHGLSFSLLLPYASEIFIAEWYQQEHAIRTRQAGQKTEQSRKPPSTMPAIVEAEDA